MSAEVEHWKKDEEAFKRHFDIDYLDFCQLIQLLSPAQQSKYEKIRATHEEAAILWAIHEGKSHGILREKQEGDEETTETPESDEDLENR
jgi:hypothetical protein